MMRRSRRAQLTIPGTCCGASELSNKMQYMERQANLVRDLDVHGSGRALDADAATTVL